MTDLDRQYLAACDAYILAKEQRRPTTTEYRKMRKLWSDRVKARAAERRAARRVAA